MSAKGCAIHYAAVNDYAKIDEKQAFIAGKTLGDIAFETIKPDSKHNWVGLSENSWDAFPPIASKTTKGARTTAQIRAIFKDYALGISTNRDDWLYGFDKDDVEQKAKALIKAYSAVPSGSAIYPGTLKWSETLKRHLKAGKREKFNPNALRKANYRPFVPRWLYQSNLFIDRTGGLDSFFPLGKNNKAICFSDIGSRTGTCILAIDQPADLHFGAAIDGYQQVPLYRFASNGEQVDNVTDWALRLFEKTYGTTGLLSPSRADATEDDAKPKAGGRPAKGSRKLSKESIFNYVYAVLYDPSYRQRYALNLRREFPRIPFYENFWMWSDWGRDLMALHIGFENVTPWPLTRTDKPLKDGASTQPAKVLLKASKDKKSVMIDSITTLSGIPPEAWTYQLGNRSALAWALEQHKEKKPKDPVIAASFNTYRLADIKEDLVDLIGKICQLSVDTVKITEAMKAAA